MYIICDFYLYFFKFGNCHSFSKRLEFNFVMWHGHQYSLHENWMENSHEKHQI
jgi:hypothetical protein